MFDAAHGDTPIALVVDEHREPTAILGTLFGACQHEVYVAIAIGDETLHPIEAPTAGSLIIGSLELCALQVGACIGLGEIHAHGRPITHTADVALSLLLTAKLIDGLSTVL